MTWDSVTHDPWRREVLVIQGVRDLLPEGAVIAGGGIGLGAWPLLGAERRVVGTMSGKRRREFAAGRHYAREALGGLGFAPEAIPVLPSREPGWPVGVVGSISHSGTDCLAVVARRSSLVSIGVDLEGADALPGDLVPMVCRGGDCRERAAVERRVGVDLPKLVFVLKEAFYKAYFPVAGCFLEFADVAVVVDAAAFSFEAHLVGGQPSCAGQRMLAGRFGRVGDQVFAVSWLRA